MYVYLLLDFRLRMPSNIYRVQELRGLVEVADESWFRADVDSFCMLLFENHISRRDIACGVHPRMAETPHPERRTDGSRAVFQNEPICEYRYIALNWNYSVIG